jgi:ATP/ADP translocase
MAEFVDYNALNDTIGLKTGNSLGSIVNSFLPTILQLAGLILFGMLVMGGFTMLAGAADKESQDKGKKMITSSLTGFLIIFLSYWIAQILQVIFKINILS